MSTASAPFYQLAPLLLVLIIDVMGLGLVLPVLGPIFNDPVGILPASTSLVIRDFLYGLTMAIFACATFFGAPFLGDLSDRIGRKKVLLISLLGTSMGFVLSAGGIIYQSVTILLLGRVIGGFTAGSQSIAQAAIIDLSNDNNKATNLSLMSIAACLGFMVGPIMGGYFSDASLFKHFNYSTPFIVAAICALGNAVALIFTFQETAAVSNKQSISLTKGLVIFIDAFKYVKLRTLVIVALAIELGWAFYFQFISLYLTQVYHYSSVEIGHFMGFMSFVFSFSMLLVIRVVLDYFSVNKLAFLTLLLISFGMFTAALFQTELMQWVCVIPIAMGVAVNWPCMLTLFSNAVDKDSQGWAMGVFSAIVSATWLISGLLMGLLSYLNAVLPLLIAGVAVAVGAGVMYFYNRRENYGANYAEGKAN